jgi:hypothetical protein
MMQVKEIIFRLIQENANEKELVWIEEKTKFLNKLPLAFVSTPRFVGKRELTHKTLTINSLSLGSWTLDRLVRVYFLLCLESSNQDNFDTQINSLFDTAEINESVALYSALPLFQNPEKWLLRATDAVRSNVGTVFDAIAFGNPFPFHFFPTLAWNQLVLKCIFNEKPIHQIYGLDERVNQDLANTLSDFAHERWAAGRKIPALVWRLVTKFLTESILKDLEILFQSEDADNQIAATLVCQSSDNDFAKKLLEKYPQKLNFEHLSWEYLENLPTNVIQG